MSWVYTSKLGIPALQFWKLKAAIHSLTGALPLWPRPRFLQELMLSLEPQVSKNTEPDGSETEMPPRDKIQPQQARQFVPTETRDNASHCLLRDNPPIPRIWAEKMHRIIHSTERGLTWLPHGFIIKTSAETSRSGRRKNLYKQS